MREYTVTKVSSQGPRTWESKFGPMETYRVMLEDTNEPIEINRKPGNDPKVGDKLFGTIETSDYRGVTSYKFKGAPRTNQPTKETPYYSKDTNEIKAEWAIGQAVAWLGRTQTESAMITDIETLARQLFQMVGRIKSSDDSAGYEKAKAIAGQIKNKDIVNQTFADGTPLPEDERINLDDIPF